jgi:3-oxoacyl-[acyl-carrier protein] reductase
MEPKGKRALVTGASRGIGLAIAERLAREGARVFLTARTEIDLRAAAEAITADGASVGFAPVDLAEFEGIESMFASAMKFLGGIDVLVNNAGINVRGPAVDLRVSDWDRVLSVNLRAAFILSKLAAPEMIRQGSGHIINIGSGASQTPMADHTAYCASKFGLLGFSESLALELRGHGVKVSIILPGSTASHFGGTTPQAKLSSMPGMLRAEDVAESVMYLLRQAPNAWTSVMNLRPLNPKKT